MRCALEDIGKNSVKPCISDKMIKKFNVINFIFFLNHDNRLNLSKWNYLLLKILDN